MKTKLKMIGRALNPFSSSGIFLLDVIYAAALFGAVAVGIEFIIYL